MSSRKPTKKAKPKRAAPKRAAPKKRVKRVVPVQEQAQERPVGRPTAFQPEFVEQAKKLCELGATNRDLADFFHVSINTIDNWRTDSAEFSEALKAGKESADTRVERSLYQRAVGYTFDAVKIFLPKDAVEAVLVPYREHCPPDTTACIFWLKNRQRDKWRDKSEHEVTGKDGGAIEFTDKDRAKAIAGLMAKLKARSDG